MDGPTGTFGNQGQDRRLSEIIDLKSFTLELKNQLKIRLYEKPNYRQDFLSIEMTSDSGRKSRYSDRK